MAENDAKILKPRRRGDVKAVFVRTSAVNTNNEDKTPRRGYYFNVLDAAYAYVTDSKLVFCRGSLGSAAVQSFTVDDLPAEDAIEALEDLGIEFVDLSLVSEDLKKRKKKKIGFDL